MERQRNKAKGNGNGSGNGGGKRVADMEKQIADLQKQLAKSVAEPGRARGAGAVEDDDGNDDADMGVEGAQQQGRRERPKPERPITVSDKEKVARTRVEEAKEHVQELEALAKRFPEGDTTSLHKAKEHLEAAKRVEHGTWSVDRTLLRLQNRAHSAYELVDTRQNQHKKAQDNQKALEQQLEEAKANTAEALENVRLAKVEAEARDQEQTQFELENRENLGNGKALRNVGAAGGAGGAGSNGAVPLDAAAVATFFSVGTKKRSTLR